ncbi:MAG: RraA family protein [Gemmatimonadaceae bacterium]
MPDAPILQPSVVRDYVRPSATLVARFKDVPTTVLSDALGRLGIMHPSIVSRTIPRLCGTAVTVNLPAGDNLMLHRALALTEAGDVLVINAQGDTSRAIMGGLMTRLAIRRGVAGIVVDGAVRDAAEMAELNFPAFTRGVSANAPDRARAGQVNVPIACGGVVVQPGDIVVADPDGIAVVPLLIAESVLARAQTLLGKEASRADDIAAGRAPFPEVVDVLRSLGIP